MGKLTKVKHFQVSIISMGGISVSVNVTLQRKWLQSTEFELDHKKYFSIFFKK